MELQKVRKFLESIKETDVEEFSFELGGVKIAFKRQEALPVSAAAPADKPPEALPGQPALPAGRARVISSPMVGTFYRAVTPESPPLLSEGENAAIGQKVCVIEAMKIMKEVTSQISGRVLKVLVENGHPVEYGQPLFELEQEGEHPGGEAVPHV